MEALRFEWDEAKNLSNRRKHGLSFEKASAVFLDPLHVSVLERIENGEERWQAVGMVGDALMLTVAYTLRQEDAGVTRVDVFRIISARPATRKERQRYEDENG